MTAGTALSQQLAPSAQSLRVLQERAAAQRPGWLYYAGWAAALAFLGWAWKGAEIRPLDLARDAGNIATYSDPTLPLAPGVVEDVAGFILQPHRTSAD